MISDKDISIVVQGPILKKDRFAINQEITKLICQRLKNIFPESELILSTWEGEEVQGISFDKVIFSKDPGATSFHYSDPKMLNNCNRLLRSTYNGIQAASRPYILKVRSDLYLTSKKFLKFFNLFLNYNEEFKFVKSRILAFSLWSIRGHKNKVYTMHKPYHISDWAYFGYKEDLQNLFDVDPIKEPEFSQWFMTRCKPFTDVAPEVVWKMPPEQYIISSFFKKYTTINFEHTADISHDNIERSAQLLMNNFVVLDQDQFCLISLKHFCFQFSKENYEWFISYSSWLSNYKRFILDHKTFDRIKYNIQINSRNFLTFLIYPCLKMINKKGFLSRMIAYFIKKQNNNL